MSKQQVSPMVWALLVAAILGLWGYGLYAGYQHYQALTQERQEVETRLYQARNAATENVVLREQVSELQAHLAILSRPIPTSEALAGLGQRIDDTALINRVALEELVRSTEASGVPGINALRFPLSATGDFASVYKFLDQLTRSSRLVRIQNLEIAVKGDQRAIAIQAKTDLVAYFQTGFQATAP